MKIHKLRELLGSGWIFTGTLVLFVFETGWSAITSRFPMAFDEAYHFGLIKFFAHHFNPVITEQAADTYKFGAIIQNPSFLYHYLMSFPYRGLALVTDSAALQVVGLRFVNIAFAVTSLLIIRKLLRVLHISDALANVIILAFALTPIFTVVSAQINYDNLLILFVCGSVYAAVAFTQQLDKGHFDMRKLLALICLCLFASLTKFAFLPIFFALAVLVAWKIISQWRAGKLQFKAVAESFARMPKYMSMALVAGIILGSFLFARFYAVNLIKYHSPAPQCDKVLSIEDCTHYFAWNNGYVLQQHKEANHIPNQWGVLQYSAWWLTVNSFELFGVLVPIQGLFYVAPLYIMIVVLLGAIMFACTVINFKKILHGNTGLLVVTAASFTYILVLWARNYEDYLRVGKPTFIHGRYLLPVLIYIYVLLAVGLRAALKDRRTHAATIKVCLALTVVFSFLYFGGIRQYVFYVDPMYGRLSPSNDFKFYDASKGN